MGRRRLPGGSDGSQWFMTGRSSSAAGNQYPMGFAGRGLAGDNAGSQVMGLAGNQYPMGPARGNEGLSRG